LYGFGDSFANYAVCLCLKYELQVGCFTQLKIAQLFLLLSNHSLKHSSAHQVIAFVLLFFLRSREDLNWAHFLSLSTDRWLRLYEFFIVVIHSLPIAFCFTLIAFNFVPKAREFLAELQFLCLDCVLNLHSFTNLPFKVHSEC